MTLSCMQRSRCALQQRSAVYHPLMQQPTNHAPEHSCGSPLPDLLTATSQQPLVFQLFPDDNNDIFSSSLLTSDIPPPSAYTDGQCPETMSIQGGLRGQSFCCVLASMRMTLQLQAILRGKKKLEK